MSNNLPEPPFRQSFFTNSTGKPQADKKIDPIWQLYLINNRTAVNNAASIDSPVFTGNPSVPTAPVLSRNSQIANTDYTDSAVAVEKGRAETEESVLQSSIANGLSGANTAIATETARAEAAEALLAPLASPAFTGVPQAPVIELTAATPTGTGTQLGLGNTVGVGNGALGNVQAPALGTGSGPATPGTVVKWLEVDIGGTKFWIPLSQ